MAVLSRLLRARSSPAFHSIRSLYFSSSLNSEIGLGDPSLLGHKPLPIDGGNKDKNVQWVFLGCPGVGKGTYAGRLSKLLGVPHIATGDLVREELSSRGPLASQD